MNMKALSMLAAIFALVSSAQAAEMEPLAEEYLLLELSLGQHDPAQVDAYFGPDALQAQAEELQLPLKEIDLRAQALAEKLESMEGSGVDPLRLKNLQLRLMALRTRAAMNLGTMLAFDEESRLLFDAVAPAHDAEHFTGILAQIDALLPGNAPLPERVTAFRERFVIPPDRVGYIFTAALEECRRRTLEHIDLPKHESFEIEYVTDKPWSAYNWYEGNSHSIIQVNTDLPIYIDQAVDLGCHEGYPGHHTYNALIEQNLVKGKGWWEFSLYPLFSPQSLIAEGSGNYGVDLAFPGEERIEYERDHLFPLAGLDPTDADRYYRLLELRAQLDHAINEAARLYLNGEFTSEQTQQWLINYALDTPEKAEKRISFFDAYRSYIINYYYGKDLVAAWVEKDAETSNERWEQFTRLLSSPLSPSDLSEP
jgi:hypothetical protein